MSTTTTIRVLTIPEVRVCCLRCEEQGTRYGAWVPLDEADDVCTDQVHRGRVMRLERGVDLHVDAPTAVLETRNMPVSGPLVFGILPLTVIFAVFPGISLMRLGF